MLLRAMLQLQESSLPSICAGKKIKRQPVRDISAENRFYGAHSKVSGIRAPGRRHRDMGSSCIVPFFYESPFLACSPFGMRNPTRVSFFAPLYRSTALFVCYSTTTRSVFVGCSPFVPSSKKKAKITKSMSYNIIGEIIVIISFLFLSLRKCTTLSVQIHLTVILSS